MEMQRILLVAVGLPRSGKSTWAKSQGDPIVNPDSIRLALHGERFLAIAEPWVWAIAHTMVRALFLAGHERVIVDGTHTTRKRRDAWQSPDWQTYFHVVAADRTVCIERARAENDEIIIPVIERMADQFEPLGDDEKRL